MTAVIEILASGIATPAPMPRAQALAEIAAGTSFLERHPEFIGGDGLRQLGGFAPGCLSEVDPTARMTHLLHTAYVDCLQSLPGGIDPSERFEVFLALPAWLDQSTEMNARFLHWVKQRDFARFRKVTYVFGGKTAGFQAAQAASDAIGSGRADRVLVAGVDCNVAPVLLDARAIHGTLNTLGKPYAAVPSEAAAFLCLGREGATTDLPQSRLRALALATEAENPADPNRGVIGRGLLGAVQTVLADLSRGGQASTLLTDFDGARFQAEELGILLATLSGDHPDLMDPVTPAAAIGDVGAAGFTLHAALVPFLAPGASPHIVLTGTDPAGPRAAALIDRVV